MRSPNWKHLKRESQNRFIAFSCSFQITLSLTTDRVEVSHITLLSLICQYIQFMNVNLFPIIVELSNKKKINKSYLPNSLSFSYIIYIVFGTAKLWIFLTALFLLQINRFSQFRARFEYFLEYTTLDHYSYLIYYYYF